jgi:hypothetical protein
MLINRSESNNGIIIAFFNAFIWICLIQSLLVYLMLFDVRFRDFSFAIMNAPDRIDINEKYDGFRALGYAYAVTYDFAVLQSFALMLIPFLAFAEKGKGKIIFYTISYFLILGTVLISGRTGFLGILFSFVLLLYNAFSGKYGQITINKKLMKVFRTSLILFIILALYYFFILDKTVRQYIEDSIVPYAFEMFLNLVNSGSVTTKSTEALSRMYFPIHLTTFLFGDGWYKNPVGPGYYMATDAGYMRQILFYGIFGSFLLYLFYVVLFLKIRWSKISMNLKIIFYFLIIYMFIVQYKGDIMMGSPFCIKFIIIYYLLLMKGENRSLEDHPSENYEISDHIPNVQIGNI